MKNKNVGYLISGISLVVAVIILIFNKTLNNIHESTCTHGSACTIYESISTQTYISLSVAALILVIGLFLIFSKEEKKVIIKTIKKRSKKINFGGLENDERRIVQLLQQESGAVFQRTMMEKLELDKVKTTRLLDKLEAKQIIERKRRGMNNIVVLKD